MVIADLDEGWRALAAWIGGDPAARRKGTACRQLCEVWRLPIDGHQRTPRIAVEARHRGHQALGVGMSRIFIELTRLGGLHDAAAIHDRDTIGVARDHAEIMRDQQQRRAGLTRNFFQEIQNLRLNRDVQRGGRLVGDDETRLTGQRHRNHDALAHAA